VKALDWEISCGFRGTPLGPRAYSMARDVYGELAMGHTTHLSHSEC